MPPLVDGVLAPVIAAEVSRLHKPPVAYLGPEKSFTWEAAVALFPHGDLRPRRSITEVFKEVESGAADYGVVPFINSLEGPVGETIDALATHGLSIVAMGEMRITLCVAKKGTPRVLFTHPHAAAQARRLIASLSAEVVYASSTSEAVAEFERCPGDCAVLASPKALSHLEKTCGVEDGESYTRFAVVSKEGGAAGRWALLIFAVPNVAGALHKALTPLAERGINMSLIYSRPTRLSPWDYFFVAEVETSGELEAALEEMRRRTTMLKTVGRYNLVKIPP
ncbi:Prephenate dehydratase [Pyrobaculum oguniense TE7]|uniref:Prephenate dehydratase n=1 Tax=Pyrobaculum oguniense (strain DSM 13380 / JCM 10595 / TE7) TaxID=698757 RepID=H6QD62_PYROT|nr:Prephenate dehydratase [Pyrobaculum oguniense TE7]